MAPRKTERQLNLVIALLAARRYLTREKIRDSVEGYQNLSDAAFQRMFERDKDDLRDLGIPIETGSNDSYFDDEQGYRILPGDFELPPVEFTQAEQVVLGIAAHVFDGAALAPQAKLRPRKAAGRRCRAVHHRLRPATAGWRRRSCQRGVGGHRRQAPDPVRLFGNRVSRAPSSPGECSCAGASGTCTGWTWVARRHACSGCRGVAGTVQALEPAGSYELPDGASSRPPPPRSNRQPSRTPRTSPSAVRQAPALRRRGSLVTAAVPEGYTAYAVPYGSVQEIADQTAAAAPDVLVLGPGEVRSATLRRLRAVADRPLSTETA